MHLKLSPATTPPAPRIPLTDALIASAMQAYLDNGGTVTICPPQQRRKR